jgi:hypothetical protein
MTTVDLAMGDAFGWANVLEFLADTPALIFDRHLDVVASNRIAVALAPGFSVGANLARFTFLNDAVDTEVDDGPIKRAQVAAILRDSLGRHVEDGDFLDLVGELALGSENFSRSWADTESLENRGEFAFVLESAERFFLRYSLISLVEPVGQTLVLWQPASERSRVILEQIGSDSRDGELRTACRPVSQGGA